LRKHPGCNGHDRQSNNSAGNQQRNNSTSLALGLPYVGRSFGLRQQIGAVPVKGIKLLELAEHGDRLEIAPGSEMLFRLRIQLCRVITRLRRCLARGSSPTCSAT
jgi:hypothetical protein